MARTTDQVLQESKAAQRLDMQRRGKMLWQRMLWLTPAAIVVWSVLMVFALEPTGQWWWRLPFYSYLTAIAVTVLIDLLQQWQGMSAGRQPTDPDQPEQS